nr:MAG TPA: hypothetical protein [Caudoviricetes sp.]
MPPPTITDNRLNSLACLNPLTYRFITCGANSRLSDILRFIISRHAPIYLCQFCYNLICVMLEFAVCA